MSDAGIVGQLFKVLRGDHDDDIIHFQTQKGQTARAIAQTEEELAQVDVDGDPRDALGRLPETTWHLTHRFGALVVAASYRGTVEVTLTSRPPLRPSRQREPIATHRKPRT